MDFETLFIFAIPVAAFALSTFAAFALGKRRNGLALGLLGLVWAGFTAMLFFAMEQAPGFDGLGYLIALIGLNAPVGVGGLIGGIIGWMKQDEPELA